MQRRPPASAPPAAAAAAVAAPAVAEAPSAEATPLSIRLTRRSLLKAVSASALLQDCGALLGDSRGSAVTNSLAVVVPRIDVFVSHSWAASRAQKFLALAIYFNRPRLARVSLAAFALCFAAEAASLPQQLPSLFPDLVFTSTADDPVRMHLLFTHLFLLLPLALLLGRPPPQRCFLDKCSVDQVDVHAKQEGIRNIGAFLGHSDRLLVCWDETYLSRLWCSFELATFLRLKQEGGIDFVSLPHATYLFSSVLANVAVVYGLALTRTQPVQERLGALLGLTPSAAALLVLFLLQLPQALLCLACSAWAARRRLLLHRQIESFSLQSRECFDEARPHALAEGEPRLLTPLFTAPSRRSSAGGPAPRGGLRGAAVERLWCTQGPRVWRRRGAAAARRPGSIPGHRGLQLVRAPRPLSRRRAAHRRDAQPAVRRPRPLLLVGGPLLARRRRGPLPPWRRHGEPAADRTARPVRLFRNQLDLVPAAAALPLERRRQRRAADGARRRARRGGARRRRR
mmetsp:Transcript_5979/g.17876  ORF Transcript_5979/g.17876 Transcript_5979/m.17876 type:complete len:513 (-) Transcript_5979:388-1926(-)